MAKTLVAIDKNGAISETTLGADSFLVLEDGQLEKTFKNDIDGMKPAQLAKVCAKLGAETLVSGDMPPKLSDVRMVKMDAGASPAWHEEEYPRNKIDEMWENIVNPLLEDGGSVVVQPMPEGDIGQLDWRDDHIDFDAKSVFVNEALFKCWPHTQCAMNIVWRDNMAPEIIAYDLLWFDKEDYSECKYIERLAKLEKILKKDSLLPYISLIAGKVLWPEASFDEFDEAVDWAFRQKDTTYVAVRDLNFQYEEPAYLEKSEGAWRIAAPPTRTLADVIAHPFKVLRELREE